MRVVILGAGYVGLVSAACFAAFGHEVVCVDQDAARIEGLTRAVMPIYEPGLDDLVARGVAAQRLTFTTDMLPHMADVEAVMIAVGTPSRRGDGYADLSYVTQAAADIAALLQPGRFTVVVTKSTVPVGTCRDVARTIHRLNPAADFAVCANPEFLREGSAIDDFMRPDRVIIGSEDDRATAVLRTLYRPLCLAETPMVVTGLETAELIKYAGNAYLATKITFINEIADLCEKVGADVGDVAHGIGLDGRIGRKFLHAGPGFGGSCFPKDALALIKTARDYDSPLRIVETVVDINDRRKASMAERIIAACGGDVHGKQVAILGVTFKPNTDDMRASVALDVIPDLQDAGAVVYAFDPVGMAEAAKMLPDVIWATDAYDAMHGAHALVILTEWNEFRALDLAQVRGLLAEPVLVDLRNIYKPDEVAAAGLRYYSIGRGATPDFVAAEAMDAVQSIGRSHKM